MVVQVKLPELGAEAGDEATVSYWIAQEGDEVSEGDDLVEMLTDKANFNVPAPCTGKIVKICVPENEVAKVGDLLCEIESGS
jgi:pyruvate/2-oxoglutarate dehydrogenase complex dihydrolipoamide acyltransferase (E2) component